MKQIPFDQANKALPLPTGDTLHFFQDQISGKIVMKWELSPEEIAKVVETGHIYTTQMPGMTSKPEVEITWRETTKEEAALINEAAKRVEVMERREKRSRKPNAKIVKLK